jgi:UDP-glucose 4-epimerase
VAGDEIVALIKEQPDPAVERMVENWNFARFSSAKAALLGFKSESTLDQIIQIHIEDELGGRIIGLTK